MVWQKTAGGSAIYFLFLYLVRTYDTTGLV
jgi:hypothetical protein